MPCSHHNRKAGVYPDVKELESFSETLYQNMFDENERFSEDDHMIEKKYEMEIRPDYLELDYLVDQLQRDARELELININHLNEHTLDGKNISSDFIKLGEQEGKNVDYMENIVLKNTIELDLLAGQEGGLIGISRDITSATKQIKACSSCGDTVSDRLEEISNQLVELTDILLGDTRQTWEESFNRNGRGHNKHFDREHSPQEGRGHTEFIGRESFNQGENKKYLGRKELLNKKISSQSLKNSEGICRDISYHSRYLKREGSCFDHEESCQSYYLNSSSRNMLTLNSSKEISPFSRDDSILSFDQSDFNTSDSDNYYEGSHEHTTSLHLCPCMNNPGLHTNDDNFPHPCQSYPNEELLAQKILPKGPTSTCIQLERDRESRAIVAISRQDGVGVPVHIFSNQSPEYQSPLGSTDTHCSVSRLSYCPVSDRACQTYPSEDKCTTDIGTMTVTLSMNSNHSMTNIINKTEASTMTEENNVPIFSINKQTPSEQEINKASIKSLSTNINLVESNMILSDSLKDKNCQKETIYQTDSLTHLINIPMISSGEEEDKENTLQECLNKLVYLENQLIVARKKNEEQVFTISNFSKQIDQLQQTKSNKTSNVGNNNFILKDLRSQIQLLEEKNCKKDSLIKKMCELVGAGPNVTTFIEKLRQTTVKPSDRRIDFDISTLISFLEKRKYSSQETLSHLEREFESCSTPVRELRKLSRENCLPSVSISSLVLNPYTQKSRQ